jgi:N-methylhydantoinase B
MRSDRRTHRPYGVQGGRPGAPSWNVLNPGPTERVLPTLPMESIALRRGDVFRMTLAGGGGYGRPLDREPARVLEDYLDDKVTLEHARQEYGVVIDPQSRRVDAAATEELRGQARSCRPEGAMATEGSVPHPGADPSLRSGRHRLGSGRE